MRASHWSSAEGPKMTIVNPLTTGSVGEPPPRNLVGPVAWMRQNLFSSVGNSLLTIVSLWLVYQVISGVLNWTFFTAVFTGADGKACQIDGAGACWPFITAKFGQFMYGRFPDAERWRVDLTYLLAAAGLIPLMVPFIPGKKWAALFVFGIFPAIAYWLLTGSTPGVKFGATSDIIGIICVLATLLLVVATRVVATTPAIRASALALAAPFAFIGLPIVLGWFMNYSGIPALPVVETQFWGGMLITLVVATVGITMSFPIGVALALGRRSKMPLVRYASVGFIEFVRGVPLITILFMSSVMLPLFMAPGTNIDKLLRALIGVSLFSGAYMAETVRGGLQAISRGQFEAADALGLSYGKKMGLIVLPQALKVVIPNIVSSFIGLFKDTSLVLIIGLFDLLGIVQQNMSDPKWFSPSTAMTGYVFAGILFWVFCFAMSRYSQFMERKLNTSHR
jgi:general L-amino acid transport system permease protein